MGWGRFLLLGNLGQQLDLQDREAEVNALRRAVVGQRRTDLGQDEKIDALDRENCELKAYVYGLARVLSRKGILTEEDLKRLVDDAEAAGET